MIAESFAYTLPDTVIMIVNRSFNCEDFFIKIKRFLALPCQPSNLKKNLALSSIFLLLYMCEVLSLSHLRIKQLEIILNDSSH